MAQNVREHVLDDQKSDLRIRIACKVGIFEYEGLPCTSQVMARFPVDARVPQWYGYICIKVLGARCSKTQMTRRVRERVPVTGLEQKPESKLQAKGY